MKNILEITTKFRELCENFADKAEKMRIESERLLNEQIETNKRIKLILKQ